MLNVHVVETVVFVPNQAPDVAKDQTVTITNLFGKGFSATVKGHMKDSEWVGVAGKIETALNYTYELAESINGDIVINRYKLVFGRGVTIIVEKNTVGYSEWKTSADGKTMYLAFDVLDTDLLATINAALIKMETNTEDFVNAIQQTHDNGWKQLNGLDVKIADRPRVASTLFFLSV